MNILPVSDGEWLCYEQTTSNIMCCFFNTLNIMHRLEYPSDVI